MYLLKPLLAVAGVGMCVASFFAIAKPELAATIYFSFAAAEGTPIFDLATGGKFFKASTVTSMVPMIGWSPANTMVLHLMQVLGVAVGLSGLLLTSSFTMGSDNRFTCGVCLLAAKIALIAVVEMAPGFVSLPTTSGPMAFNALVCVAVTVITTTVALGVNRYVKMKCKTD